jgi:hypothetical protein
MLDKTLIMPQVACLIMFTPSKILYQCGQRSEVNNWQLGPNLKCWISIFFVSL